MQPCGDAANIEPFYGTEAGNPPTVAKSPLLKTPQSAWAPIARRFTIGDVQLRHAGPTDAIAVARVHVRSWQAAYRKLMPDEYLDQLRPEDRAKKYNFGSLDPLQPHTSVLTESGVIRGFATTVPAQDLNMPDYGELCAPDVDPPTGAEAWALHLCQQRGLGFSIWDFEKQFSGY